MQGSTPLHHNTSMIIYSACFGSRCATQLVRLASLHKKFCATCATVTLGSLSQHKHLWEDVLLLRVHDLRNPHTAEKEGRLKSLQVREKELECGQVICARRCTRQPGTSWASLTACLETVRCTTKTSRNVVSGRRRRMSVGAR
jgi:hypothetical protein